MKNGRSGKGAAISEAGYVTPGTMKSFRRPYISPRNYTHNVHTCSRTRTLVRGKSTTVIGKKNCRKRSKNLLLIAFEYSKEIQKMDL